MTFSGGERGEGEVSDSNCEYKKKKFKNNGEASKHRILQQEGDLYIKNMVIRGAGNIICVYKFL